MRIFGREPVYYLATVAIILKLVAALAAAVGVASAIVLKTGAVAASILNFAQAGLALFVAFGLNMDAHQQGLIMSGVAAVLALVLHAQVTAPVPTTSLEKRTPVKPIQ
jgi:hypothetical protein